MPAPVSYYATSHLQFEWRMQWQWQELEQEEKEKEQCQEAPPGSQPKPLACSSASQEHSALISTELRALTETLLPTPPSAHPANILYPAAGSTEEQRRRLTRDSGRFTPLGVNEERFRSPDG